MEIALRLRLCRSSKDLSVTKITPEFGALVKVAPSKPCEHHGRLDTRSRQNNVGSLAHHRIGAVERSARRQLEGRDEIAAIERRHEARRRAAKKLRRHADQQAIDDKREKPHAHQPRGPRAIALRHGVEEMIEAREESMDERHHPPFRFLLLLVSRFQENRGERRRQSERHESRDQRRRGDGDRELLVEGALQPGDIGDRHENRAEHQRNCDQRAADLVHGLVRGLLGRHAEVEIAFDILDDDDRVVDDNADGEHQSEKRQRVEGEAQELHHQKAADEGHRNRHHRNHRGAPCLQEENDHHDNEQDRFEKRVDDLIDGLLNEFGRIVDDRIIDAGRKLPLQLDHGGLDQLGGREGVGAGLLKDDDGRRGVFVEIGVDRIILRADLHARHVPQPHLPIGVRAQHDVGELLGLRQAAERAHGKLEGARATPPAAD